MSRIYRVVTSPMDNLPPVTEEDLVLPSDYPIGGITSLQMEKALLDIQEGLYKHNATYLCLTNGTYQKDHFYRFNISGDQFSWVDIGELGGGKPTIVTQWKKVLQTDWVADNTYADYGYKADITVSGVTSKDFSIVSFAPEDADTGNYASVCNTDTNKVTIYCKSPAQVIIPIIMTIQTNTTPRPTYAPIYGVKWTNDASTTMTRTDDAVGMTYTDNNGRFTSDFDNVFPYKQMIKVQRLGGNYVQVPEMWFRIGYDSSNKIVSVAVSQEGGEDYVEENINYVWHKTKRFDYGAYKGTGDSTNLLSVTGGSITRSQMRSTFRTRATNSNHRHLVDLYSYSILRFLFWIEFANKAAVSYPATLNGVFPQMPGTTEVTPGGTTNFYNETPGVNFCVTGYDTTTKQMVWHGIEDFVGNIREWLDGITADGTAGGNIYVSDNYNNYEDYDATTTPTKMNRLAFSGVTGEGDCVEAFGWDNNNPFLVVPIAVRDDDTYTTGFVASTSIASNYSVFVTGVSNRSKNAAHGLSHMANYQASTVSSNTGGRVIYAEWEVTQ